MRSISTGLCSSGTNGPKTPLRGPSISACAAARCASVIASARGSGRRSGHGWLWPWLRSWRCAFPGRVSDPGSGRSAASNATATPRWRTARARPQRARVRGRRARGAGCRSSAASTGPAICPIAKAAVMRPSAAGRIAARAGARLLHPGHRRDHEGAADQERRQPAPSSGDSCSTGSRQPSAISRWLPASTRCRERPPQRARGEQASRAAAVAPKTGQATPNTRGSSTTARASTGRKVAGRM